MGGQPGSAERHALGAPHRNAVAGPAGAVRDGVFEQILAVLAGDLQERGGLDLSECFIDGIFVSAKKGAGVGPTKRGKGCKIMAVADRAGLPLAVHVGSASPAEVTLVASVLAESVATDAPHRLIGDKAYDSNGLDAELARRKIDMIAPHRAGRIQSKTKDGRKLRRYRRRWKVERLIAWLHNFRRILVRHEYKLEDYRALGHLGCIRILLRQPTFVG